MYHQPIGIDHESVYARWGLENVGLTDEERKLVMRFDSEHTIGFFLAKFRRIK